MSGTSEHFKSESGENDINEGEKFIIPDHMPKFIDSLQEKRYKAELLTRDIYLYVSWNWVSPLTEWIGHRKCLEVRGGRGILSYALREKGVDVICTDDVCWELTPYNKPIVDVENLHAIEAVTKYGKDIDILIFAQPYNDPTAYTSVKILNKENPDALIIYIGEYVGGFLANSDFFRTFEEIDDDLFSKVKRNYEGWRGSMEGIMLGRYVE